MNWGNTATEQMQMKDPASLQNLNDIVVPGPPPWWPPAPGWYVLAAVVAVGIALLLLRWVKHRRRNRYRYLALKQLASIRQDGSVDALQHIPALLKRAALTAWPRQQVASLSGPDWHRFLDASAGTERFSSGAGAALDWLAYTGSASETPAGPERAQILDAAEYWLKHHQNRQGKD